MKSHRRAPLRKKPLRESFGSVAVSLMGMLAALSPHHALAAESQQVTMYVFGGSRGLIGADAHQHDTFVPTNVVLRAGVPVKIAVVNYDEGPHTMTVPGLRLNAKIKPGIEHNDKSITPVTTTFTFMPLRKGVFRWHCEAPCDTERDGWAMRQGYSGPDKEGFMAGDFVVI